MATEHSGIVDWSSAQVWALRRTSTLSLSAVNGSTAHLIPNLADVQLNPLSVH